MNHTMLMSKSQEPCNANRNPRHAYNPLSGEWRKTRNNQPCPITPSSHHNYVHHSSHQWTALLNRFTMLLKLPLLPH